ncbi:hypothetical protein [Streptomyces sp. URMC 123]|uniref:hypothetical protein n=1 Tax=Streptomyces sp. URMC 123 TaxID=3423403 RepID=UPI003F1C4800
MRRRFLTLALSAVIAGGALTVVVPAQPAAAAKITCNYNQMQNDIAKLRAKAQRMKREGEPEAARRATQQADAIQRQLNSCKAAEENNPTWPR